MDNNLQNQSVEVSIVCNVYNHGNYLRETLDGFVMQKTSFPFEVLVHDDASTDNSAEIIREYEAKYPEIIKPIYQTVNQYSQDVSITPTIQVPRAKGKYIAICEGDDFWIDPLKLQKQFDFLEQNPEYSLCSTSVLWRDMRSGKDLKKCNTEEDRDVSIEELILEKKGRVFQYATVFAKTEVFRTLPEWTRNYGVGDTPLQMHAALTGKIRMLADVTAVYRNHAPGSWTSRIDENLSYKVSSFRKMIGGLTAFNEATQFQYNDVVTQRIRQLKYNIAKANRDWKALRSGELLEIFKSRRLVAKISDFLVCKAPRLQKLILKFLK